MNTFLLMYIAILFSLYTIPGMKILLLFKSASLPIIALILTAVFFAIYKATLYFLSKKSKDTTYYTTTETDEEKTARINAEIDKIIEEQRKNKREF